MLRYRGTATQSTEHLQSDHRLYGLYHQGFDFTRWGAPAILLSLVIIGAGVVTMATKGLPLGIDFSGGTLVIARVRRAGRYRGRRS